MNQTKLDFQFPKDFNFGVTVYSHGWCSLAPFMLTTEPLILSRVIALPRDRVVRLRFNSARAVSRPEVIVEHSCRLSDKDLELLRMRIRRMFNLGLDLRAFYAAVKCDPGYAWAAKIRAGRLLRGETMFEDVAKMLLTTNCSWALTERMNNRLIEMFGAGRDNMRAFPTPETIAASNEAVLRADAKLGYRAPFMLELAERCASGKLDIESLGSADIGSDEIYKQLRNIKGIGDYAAGNLLKLLGHFDRLGLDSWCRMRFAELHNGSTQADDAAIESHYDRYGRYRGLILWLDVTKHWYEREGFIQP
jgi:3-methyladenine DNA glycosylase/8-oxoguanine DNA glycosylase